MMLERFIYKRVLTACLLTAVALTAIVGFLQMLSGLAEAAQPQITAVSGPIVTDTMWTLANSPYVITEPVSIQPGATLTVEAGVTIMAGTGVDASIGVEENGRLVAQGLSGQPITFTSVSKAGPNDWTAIVVRGYAYLDHTVFEHSLYNIDIIGASGEAVVLQNSALRNGTYGLRVDGDALHRLQMSNLTFTNNVTNHVFINTVNEWGNDTRHILQSDVTLSAHTGLKGYELPYLLNVPGGITLTLAPGVIVKASSDGYVLLDIEEGGHLEAAGTIDEPVILTSISDDVIWPSLAIIGSAHFNHTEFRNSFFNIELQYADGGPILVENSTIRDGIYGLYLDGDTLHRLTMDNVSFTDNLTNSVYIDTREGWTGTLHNVLQDDARLTAQPGLDSYIFPNYPLVISNGVTLTVDPGVTVKTSGAGAATFWVQEDGRFVAEGTPSQPITFTSTANSAPGQYTTAVATTGNGSVTIDHAIFQYGSLNLHFGGEGGERVVKNSTFRHSDAYGMVVEGHVLNDVQLTDLAFDSNARNRIAIFRVCDGDDRDFLRGDVALYDYQGLDGYEFVSDCYPEDESHRLVVPADTSLTLFAGANLYLPANVSLNISGKLAATGTLTMPVVITGTVPVWASETADPLPWAGITLSGTAHLHHTHVAGAANSGITVLGGNLQATCAQFTHNQDYGLFIDAVGTPYVVVQQSNVIDNADGGVRNESVAQVDARYNWWGDPIGPGGNDVTGSVLVEPWLTAPGDCGGIPPFALYLPLINKP